MIDFLIATVRFDVPPRLNMVFLLLKLKFVFFFPHINIFFDFPSYQIDVYQTVVIFMFLRVNNV